MSFSFHVMIENLRHTTPGPETGCRRTVLADSSSMLELNGERQRCLRRKRLGLRRVKSLDQLQSRFPDGIRCLKRKRSGNGRLRQNKQSDEEEECSDRKAAVVSLSFASSSSNDQLKNKDVVIAGTSSFVDDKDNPKNVRWWSHGSISVIGRRREMEDAVAVEVGCLARGSKGYDFFGVYDGHGGSSVANACRDRLHKLLVEILEQEDDMNTEGSINWNKVMMKSFEKIDEEVNRNGEAMATMGSTAVVAVVGEEEVVIANCGDSRAVLSRGGVAVPLSNDHKPDRSDELERIELSGGKVINWNGQRVLGVLATSRSIGDHYLKPYVISDPEVIVSKRTSRDDFLVLASDGLWDVIPNDVACHVARRCLYGQIKRVEAESQMVNRKRSSEINTADGVGCNGIEIEHGSPAARAAALLAELAIARGSRDNISVIVVELRRSAC